MDWRDHIVKMALRIGPALLIMISFIAFVLAITFHATTIDELKFREPSAHNFEPNVIIGEDSNDLVWFLQVTDLHLSSIGHYDRETDLKEFVDKYIDIVNPDAVLVTGDITDGMTPNTTIDSRPQLEEWKAYSRAISSATNKTSWLDVRGNHDNFNVYRPVDPQNLFRQFSIQGRLHPRNYHYILTKAGKNYSFFGLDEVQTPGLRMPFNFLGVVKDDDMTELKNFRQYAKGNNSQYNIWFAHYPTSSIASPGEGLRSIVDGPYLCGHFHTISNWVIKMHATQQPGFAEVELGDWKYNRRLRLAAIDHQLFSLVDFNFKQFPIALMTNPKNAEYAMPRYEPIDRIMNSTHIRVIAFSDSPITKVEVSIDKTLNITMKPTKGPLYVARWNPTDFRTGLHTADISVHDSEGKSITYIQKFSMDNSKDEPTMLAKILIRPYFRSMIMSVFYSIVVICTLPLLILKMVTYEHSDTGLRRHYKGTFLYKLHILSKIDRVYWSLSLIPIWVAIGPLFVGRLVDEAIGVCFVWGILIDGTFIHTGITYSISSIHLLFIHIPATILIVYQVSNCHKSTLSSNSKPRILNVKFGFQGAFALLQLYMGYLLYSAYGVLAFLTSFQFVWSIFLYYYCWFQCTQMGKSVFSAFGPNSPEERQALTSQKTRDDKSSSSDHSTF